MTWRLRLGLLLLPALSTLAHERAGAFSWFQWGPYDVVWVPSQSVRYLSPSTFPPGSQTHTLILESMGLWNIVPACEFTYSYINAPQDYEIDNFDGFSDTAAVPAATLDPGVLGVTYLVNDGPVWYDMDVVFSDLPQGVGYTLEGNPPCDVVTAPTPVNGFSFLLVAVHEMGHALGLGHEPQGNEPSGFSWFVATMNPRYPSGGPIGQENIVELHTDDRNGARYLYPHSGPSGPPYRDLASAGYTAGPIVGKAIPLFFSPTSVGPGGTVSMRSVIENFGTSNEFFVAQGFYLSVDDWIEASDLFLGELLWDIAFEDAFDFDVDVEMPADIAAGTYHLGTILDDLDEVDEEYEDNNAVSYCTPLTITRLAPVINNLGQDVTACGQPYASDAPTVTHPINMAPITWSLDNPQPGMTINPASGVVSWASPAPSPFPYLVYVRATNSSGSSTSPLFIGVTSATPVIAPIADASLSICATTYAGPTPAVTNPSCMNPILTWSLDTGPPGMTINFGTGVVSWPNVQPSATPLPVTIRATNAVGSGTRTWHLRFTGGDLNGDSLLTPADVPGFVDVLLGGNVAGAAAADVNCDGVADGRDVQTLVNLLLGG